MKRILILLALLAVWVSAYSKTITDIDGFYGGYVDLRMGFYSDSLYGARGDGQRMGGTVSTLDFHQSFSSYNPACLAVQRYPVVAMSFIPSGFVSTDTMGKVVGVDLGKTVTDALNKTVDDITKDMYLAPGVDPKFESAKVSMGQEPGITGFEWMVPFAKNNAGYGVAREEKSMFKMSALVNGGSANVRLSDDTLGSVTITAQFSADIMVDVDARYIQTSIGIGRKMTPAWSMGVALDRYESRISANGSMSVQGMVSDNDNIFPDETFGDNPDGSDSLDAKGFADLTAEAWAFRVGTTYHFGNDEGEVGLDFAVNPELKYKGDMYFIHHNLPDTIDMANMDQTVLMQVDTPDDIRIKLPSFGRVTLAWKPGIVLAFNYTRYFEPMYIIMDKSKQSVYLNDAIRLGFNFGGFQMGGGVYFSKQESETEKDGTVTKSYKYYTVPVASLGFVFPVGTYMDCETVLMALPMPVLKCAVSYKF